MFVAVSDAVGGFVAAVDLVDAHRRPSVPLFEWLIAIVVAVRATFRTDAREA